MKSHELAEGLRALAALLKKGPNVDLRDLDFLLSGKPDETPLHAAASPKDDLPVMLSALLSLSKIDKSDWAALILDLGLSIPVGPRDSSRDLVGKVLRHLERDPEARNILMKKVRSRDTRASPELARALSSLLGQS